MSGSGEFHRWFVVGAMSGQERDARTVLHGSAWVAGAAWGHGRFVGDDVEALWGIGQDVSTVGLSEGPQVGRERDHGDTVLVAGVLGMWSVGWMGRRWGLGVG